MPFPRSTGLPHHTIGFDMWSVFKNGLVRHSDLNWALLDQSTASGVNFLTTVILARQLGLEGFGVFMLAWMVLLFFKGLQGGLILSPLMSIGPKQELARRDCYDGAVLVQQIAFALCGAGLILIGGKVVDLARPDWAVSVLVLPLAFAMIGDQLQEYWRRYFFTRSRAALAFAIDAATYGSRTVLLLVFLDGGSASEVEALWFIFASSLCGLLVAVPGLRGLSFDRTILRETVRRHWTYARWTAASALLEWGSGYLIVIVAGGVIGPAAVGAVRATTNVFAPIQVMTQALANAVPVRAARLFAEDGEASLLAYLSRVMLGGLLVCSVIIALGSSFPEKILLWLYGAEYAQNAFLVHWWGVIYLFTFLQFPLSAGLTAVEYTRPFFISIIGEAAFGMLAAYALPIWFGIDGVMFGILVTRALPVFVLGWFAFRWWRTAKGRATPPHPEVFHQEG
jgi:O-antigen/teichoic acid export membrane protein